MWWNSKNMFVVGVFEVKVMGLKFLCLTILHSEWPKLCGVLAILGAIGLVFSCAYSCVKSYSFTIL